MAIEVCMPCPLHQQQSTPRHGNVMNMAQLLFAWELCATDITFCAFVHRMGVRELVRAAWAGLKPVVWPAAWLFIGQTLMIMLVDRFTHRLVNEGAHCY